MRCIVSTGYGVSDGGWNVNFANISCFVFYLFFFFNDTATTEIYTLSLHDALPICHFFLSGFQPKVRKTGVHSSGFAIVYLATSVLLLRALLNI